jgi:pimeloyl-ACP methyl ester carboxylesterase
LLCEAAGDPGAPLVLCLHGHHPSSAAQDWRTHLPVLAEHGFRAVAVTFPGFGSIVHGKSEGAVLPDRPDTALMPGGGVAAVLDLIAQLTQGAPQRSEDPQEGSLLLPPLGHASAGGVPATPPSRQRSSTSRQRGPVKAALIGEGWGASVALACAQWEPQVVSSLVLYHVFVNHGRWVFVNHHGRCCTGGW